MIVTIDGPAGAGKSTLAQKLADTLGFEFLDTGAMYRTVTLACLRAGIPVTDEDEVAACALDCLIEFEGDQVFLNGEDVSAEIRSPEVSVATKWIADNVEVRRQLVSAQQRWGEQCLATGRNGVTEGRDQGTVAFPNAECKIFLTATPETRANRRVLDLQGRGMEAEYETVLAAQIRRDADDRARPVGALVQADDAIVVDTDTLSESEVLHRLIEIVLKCQEKSKTL